MPMVCMTPLLDNTKLMRLTGARLLGGVTALLKVEGGIVAQDVSNECVKLFGSVSCIAFWLAAVLLTTLQRTGSYEDWSRCKG